MRCRVGVAVVGITALAGAACTSSDPQIVVGQAQHTDLALTVDPEVLVGELPNGLVYYVRENDRPGGEVQVRLAVDAGSMLEEPDQAGVAHFLEHMLFNGTEKYPRNELVEVLRGFGLELGADLNAYTSYDETVYQLSVPNDDDSVELALDVLHEWLSAATLAEADVVAERGVVLDEWRQHSQSSDGRGWQAFSDMLFDGTSYAGREPIGTQEAVAAMSPDVLRRFYDRWYRPDNAAVIVVGDIDADDVAETIDEIFASTQPRTAEPLTRPAAAWTSTGSPAAAVHLDPDVTEVAVDVVLPTADVHSNEKRERSLSDVRAETLVALAMDVVTTRLADDVRRGSVPLTSAVLTEPAVARGVRAPGIAVTGPSSDAAGVLDAVLVEMERAARFGLASSEVDRAIERARAGVETAYEGRDTLHDGLYADQYVAHFLTATPLTDASTAYRASTSILDSIGAEEVSATFAELWASARPRVLLVAPQSAAAVPTAHEVLSLVEQLGARELQPRAVDPVVSPEDGVMARPEPVQETSATELDGDGFDIKPTLLTFPNRVEVVINRTGIVEGQLIIYAAKDGGLSLVEDADVPSAVVGPTIVAASGAGSLDAVALDRVLGASSVAVSPYLASEEAGFYGSSSTADLELALGYLHLLMTEPRVDQASVDTVLASERAAADSVRTEAEMAAAVALDIARYGDTPRYRTQLTAEELETVDPSAIFATWRHHFGDASGWRFVISGDVDPDEVVVLARAYLGTLPGSGSTTPFLDRQPPMPDGVVRSEVRAGTGDRAQLQRIHSVDAIVDARTMVLADLLDAVLNARLTTRVREELGASYSPYAVVYWATVPRPTVEVYVDVSGAPDGIDRLHDVVTEELRDIAVNGPRAHEASDAFAAVERDYGFVSTDEIAAVLMEHRRDESVIKDYVFRANTLEGVTPEDLAAFAAVVLDPERYVEVIARPA